MRNVAKVVSRVKVCPMKCMLQGIMGAKHKIVQESPSELNAKVAVKG